MNFRIPFLNLTLGLFEDLPLFSGQALGDSLTPFQDKL